MYTLKWMADYLINVLILTQFEKNHESLSKILTFKSSVQLNDWYAALFKLSGSLRKPFADLPNWESALFEQGPFQL